MRSQEIDEVVRGYNEVQELERSGLSAEWWVQDGFMLLVRLEVLDNPKVARVVSIDSCEPGSAEELREKLQRLTRSCLESARRAR